MFTYLTRKVQMLFQFPYTDRKTIKEIIDSEFESFEDQQPMVYFTINPFYCLIDTAEDLKYEHFTNRIRVCSNLISSEQSLKASIAREKY